MSANWVVYWCNCSIILDAAYLEVRSIFRTPRRSSHFHLSLYNDRLSRWPLYASVLSIDPKPVSKWWWYFIQGWEFCEKFVFFLNSRIPRIPTEDIDSICSLESGLSFSSISSVRILDIFKVIAKTSFSKIAKCATLTLSVSHNHLRRLVHLSH